MKKVGNEISKEEEQIIEYLSNNYKIRPGMIALIIPSEAYEQRKLESGYIDRDEILKKKENANAYELKSIENQEKIALDQRNDFENKYFTQSNKLKLALIGDNEDDFLKVGDVVSMHGHARLELITDEFSHVTENGYTKKELKFCICRSSEVMMVQL